MSAAFKSRWIGGTSLAVQFAYLNTSIALSVILMHQPCIAAAAISNSSVAYIDTTVETDGAFHKVILDGDMDIDADGITDDTMNDPMEISVAIDGRVFFIERSGRIKTWEPSSGSSRVLAKIPVFSSLEDGLLGIALDPSFLRNGYLYVYYSAQETVIGANRERHGENRVSRFTIAGEALDLASEKVLLRIPTQRDECCHSGGSLTFDSSGNLFVSTGDNTNPLASNGFSPLDERVGRSAWSSERTSSNANDLRGKILRILPMIDGSYAIPAGNLYPPGTPNTRPEVYVMGCRNPFRISIDQESGFLYWGDIGPDAKERDDLRGPAGFDEINQARNAGNFGWPYFVADNKAYRSYNFATHTSGKLFDAARPLNTSRYNSGPQVLPPAQPALIWYPYGQSSRFPYLDGSMGRSAMAGPVYHYDSKSKSAHKIPKDFDNCLFVYDWSASWIRVVHLDRQGNIAKSLLGRPQIEPFCPKMRFHKPIDLEIGGDGCLYVLEYGSGWTANTDSRLVKIQYRNATSGGGR